MSSAPRCCRCWSAPADLSCTQEYGKGTIVSAAEGERGIGLDARCSKWAPPVVSRVVGRCLRSVWVEGQMGVD